jgi:alkanesulfonate monooxygenase
MTRTIRLNAFDMSCVVHQSPGLWTHPADRALDYNTLDYWVDLARLLEKGKFDALFIADVLGIYDVYRGGPGTALAHAVQVPVNDPMMLISAMAHATEHLGFGVTCGTTYEHPYPFARRMSTLDHLTKGRIGWNIVTGYLDSAARGMGETQQTGHDDRYEMAEDYMAVVYKLWEGSWEDGAVLRDTAGRRFADPARIHKVTHKGPYYRCDAVHLCEPSPQRTPVLFQAGASGRGQRFAATHAECVFVNGPSQAVIGRIVASLREAARTAGRDPEELVVFTMMTVITGRTSREAQEKLAEYRAHADEEGALTLMSGWTGIDFSKLDPDAPLAFQKTDAMLSALRAFTDNAEPGRVWTAREIARHACIGGRGPVVVGSAQEVADALQDWVEKTGVDGFNLAYAVTPGSFADIVGLVVPILQERGVFKRDYAPGTLREKLYGAGRARLGAGHPAAGYRR